MSRVNDAEFDHITKIWGILAKLASNGSSLSLSSAGETAAGQGQNPVRNWTQRSVAKVSSVWESLSTVPVGSEQRNDIVSFSVDQTGCCF